jgi:O-antigen biosynthesis protein
VHGNGNEFRSRLAAVRSRIAAKNTVTPAEMTEVVSLLEEVIRQMEWRSVEQSRLDERLSRLENSLIFRFFRGAGSRVQLYKRKLGQALLNSAIHPLYAKLRRPPQDTAYREWLRHEEANTPSWEWHRERAQQWRERPLISIVMATHNPRREWLDAAINSVLAQSYPFWELTICDDASPGWVARYLQERAQREPRLRYCLSSEPLGISGAFNRAGKLARGEYAGFLDHDDVLSPLALHYVAESIQNGPADLIYTDEDYLAPSGARVRPSLKPAWSPELLLDCMYCGHFLVVSRKRLDEIGWFRSEYDGAQDYDAVLRITDQPAVVLHVPQILYHWRQHEGSTAAAHSAKQYTHDAGRRALEDTIRRRGWDAEVKDGGQANTYRVRPKMTVHPAVSVIICSRNAQLLQRCLGALEATRRDYPLQVVVVQHQIENDGGMGQVIERFGCDVAPFSGEFNFARMNNLGATISTGEVLLFLNDDVMPLSADWLPRLLEHAMRPEVGVVGAKLVYPSGAIQHAGIVVGMMEGAAHVGRGLFNSDLWRWLDQTRNVSAVTGACMAIRKAVFADLGGFDPEFPVNYNDVDLCLRARQAGYEIIFEAGALLRHDECQTRKPGTRLEERERFYQRWADELKIPDPYFSPLLSSGSEEIRMRAMTRSEPGCVEDGLLRNRSGNQGSLSRLIGVKPQ